jgi:hypothetical protein
MLGVFEQLSVGPTVPPIRPPAPGVVFPRCGILPAREAATSAASFTKPISSEASVAVGKTCETYETPLMPWL